MIPATDTNAYQLKLENAQDRINDLEARLRESEQMLRTIIDTLPAHIYWRDLDLKFLGCNTQFAKIAGFNAPEELIGKTDYDVAQPAYAAQYQADDRRVIESGVPKLEYEEQGVSPAGEPQWFRSSKMPLYDADGRIIGILGFFQDVTAQKQEAMERERLQQEIIHMQRHALEELSTPIIPVTDGIIVMPLVGGIDTERSRDIMRALLEGITQHKAKVAILDITGVPVVDTGVAQHLDKTVQAARLKGTRTMVTGVSEAVAETIVDLGIDWGRIETLSDLQTGLKMALRSLGLILGG